MIEQEYYYEHIKIMVVF